MSKIFSDLSKNILILQPLKKIGGIAGD